MSYLVFERASDLLSLRAAVARPYKAISSAYRRVTASPLRYQSTLLGEGDFVFHVLHDVVYRFVSSNRAIKEQG